MGKPALDVHAGDPWVLLERARQLGFVDVEERCPLFDVDQLLRLLLRHMDAALYLDLGSGEQAGVQDNDGGDCQRQHAQQNGGDGRSRNTGHRQLRGDGLCTGCDFLPAGRGSLAGAAWGAGVFSARAVTGRAPFFIDWLRVGTAALRIPAFLMPLPDAGAAAGFAGTL